MAAKKVIKVGVVGYGPAYGMGKYHFDQMAATGVMQPFAACDLNEKQLEVARQQFPGIETYTSVDEMLRKSEVELLAIILPHNLHASIAVKCLKAGRHVVVEKPFAITVDECDQMIAAARKSKVMLSTFHNRHWDANILTIMKHLPKIGRPYRWESFHGSRSKPREWWRSDKKVSGGIIFDWGAHFTEWMLQVMPGQIQDISGFMVNEVWKHVTNEDEVTAVVRFKDGAMAMHTDTSLDGAPKATIRIAGTQGTIIATHGSVELHYVDDQGARIVATVPLEARACEKYYQNVADHLLKGKKLVITAEKARRVIQVLDYACRSAQSGKQMKAKYA